MENVGDKLPQPIGKLDDFAVEGTSATLPLKVYIGHNLGSRTFLTTLPMHEFFRVSEVANVRGKNGEPIAQRKLDPAHARKLAVYMLKGLVTAAIEARRLKEVMIPEIFLEMQKSLGKQPYMSLQPIVVNIRECNPRGENIPGFRLLTKDEETAGFKIYLAQNHVLWVVDGQHRKKGMELVFEFLNFVRDNHRYPAKRGSLIDFALGKELDHEELAIWEEAFSPQCP